jgi:predicted Zn-dependent protease
VLSVLSGLFGGGNTDPCADQERYAAATMARIKAEWPLRGSADPVSLYVQDLGERLARSSDAGHGIVPRFFILRNLEPNAFAVGGGRYVVTDGTFRLVNTESELAAVLAHELSHQRAGHFCRRDTRDTKTFYVGSLVQHFDLNAELEADAMAVELLRRAGFDPAAMATVLRRIAAEAPAQRRKTLTERLKGLGDLGQSARARNDSPEFLDIRRQVERDLPSGDGAK